MNPIRQMKFKTTRKVIKRRICHIVVFLSDYSCYYCNDYATDNEHDYEHYVVIKHDGKPAYPNKAEIEKSGLIPKGMGWEI
jgi:hypothetical protein